jgi:Na+-transporting NADH:ubiquinone oxidoreductase subunit C
MLTAVAALMLSFLATSLKPLHDMNEAIFNKRGILSAVQSAFDTEVKDMSDEQVATIFDESVEQIVLDMDGNTVEPSVLLERGYKGELAEHVEMTKEKKRPEADRILPLFIYNDNGTKYYIVSVIGSGLWDEIWGNVALEEDLNTVAGVTFDHKAETPGLGAEIKDNKIWKSLFTGKKIYNDGVYTSVVVRKNAKDPNFEIDAISGATITSVGVTEMLDRGIKYYEPYLNKLKNQ